MSTQTNEWLTVDQMAAEYPFPAGTLYGWRHRGIGPKSVRLGKRVVYRRADVETWIAQQEMAERNQRERALMLTAG